MNTRILLSTVLSLAMMALTGCEEMKNAPVSLEGTPLPGQWYGERQQQMGKVLAHDRLYMQVSEEGYVSYFYLACESGATGPVKQKRLSLNHVPVKRITTVKMVLQTYPLTPKFELSLGAWPDMNEGTWVVDEIPLRQIKAGDRPDPEQWQCENPQSAGATPLPAQA